MQADTDQVVTLEMAHEIMSRIATPVAEPDDIPMFDPDDYPLRAVPIAWSRHTKPTEGVSAPHCPPRKG